MEFEVKEFVKIEDGKHQGNIVGVEYRDTPYQYVDVFIKIGDTELKAGYPAFIAKDSRLGKLLERFGAILTAGTKLDPEKILKGEDCSFITMTRRVKDKEYADIIADSVKPWKVQEDVIREESKPTVMEATRTTVTQQSNDTATETVVNGLKQPSA